MQNSNNGSQFFISIFTAIVVGVGIAYAGIFVVTMAIHRPRTVVMKAPLIAETKPAYVVNDDVNNEEDKDPTFISHFSRGYTYSADSTSEDQVEESILSSVNPHISALAYSVMSVDRGNVLIEQDADRLLPIASVTKIVTAVIAKKVFDEDDTITVTSRELLIEGDTGRLRLGEKFKVKEILYPLLMVSSNDAAEVLAQAYDSQHTRGAFVREMNSWANSIGAYRTYFLDPSGLSPSNVSTAHDIAIIAQWIKQNQPSIFDITLTKSKSIRLHTWINPTHFLNLSSYDGGKNGYIPEADLTSVSLFSFGSPKRYYSVVLLGSKQRDADTLAVLNKALK